MTDTADSVEAMRENSSQLLIAFASSRGEQVDEHFGSACAFYVYVVDVVQAQLLAKKELAQEKRDGNEDKLRPRLTWLTGCDALYCGSVGGSATRQLIQRGITPLQVSGAPTIQSLIERIQGQLSGEPEFWLANIMRKKQKNETDSDRFALSAGDSWE